MYDRDVQYPNRYQIVKVQGTDDIYELTPAPGTITQEGTPINKATLLKDQTASLFGLTNTAVPDDVLSILGNFKSNLVNDYVWGKYKLTKDISIATSYSSTITLTSASTTTVYFTAVVENGVVTVKDPVTVTGTRVARKYYLQDGNVYYLEYHGSSSDREATLDLYPVSVGSNDIPGDLIGYVNSGTENAYPDNGTSGGYFYIKTGKLGGFPDIVEGTFVLPNNARSFELNFAKEPQMVIIFSAGFGGNNITLFAFLIKPMVNSDSVSGQVIGVQLEFNYLYGITGTWGKDVTFRLDDTLSGPNPCRYYALF